MFDKLLQPDRFHRFAIVASLVSLAIINIAGLIARPNFIDFYQYYMGGVVAQTSQWHALYPIPKEGLDLNAGLPTGSMMHPDQARLAAARGVLDNENRFIQPPIMALFHLPLAWMDVKTAAWVWTICLVLSCWVICICAGEIFKMTSPRPSRWSGVVVLSFAGSMLAFRAVRSGNVSCVIGACVGLFFIGLMRKRDFLAGLSLMFAILAKYAAGILAPLGLIMQRWRFVAWMMILALALLLTLLVTGLEPWQIYIDTILPTVAQLNSWRGNSTLSAGLIRAMGGTEAIPRVESIMMIVRPLAIALLIGIFALIFIKRVQIRTSPRHAAAACCALLAWWPLASPLFWTHYFVYFVPFWGWLIAEGLRSRARMAMAVLIIGSMWVCISGIPALPLPELLESHMFIAAMLLLGYAIWFLARRENVAA